jgi:peptidyl-tRNA hydrolase
VCDDYWSITVIIKMYAIFARETLRQMQFEGKLAAQAGHCYLHAWWDAELRLMYDYKNWNTEGRPSLTSYGEICSIYRDSDDARKITLVVDTVDELRELYDTFRPHMGATLVEDCGYTVFDQPTITGVGLGPIPSDWTKGTRLGDLDTLRNEIHVE